MDRTSRVRMREWRTAGPTWLMLVGVFVLLAYAALLAFGPPSATVTALMLSVGILALVSGFAWGARQKRVSRPNE